MLISFPQSRWLLPVELDTSCFALNSVQNNKKWRSQGLGADEEHTCIRCLKIAWLLNILNKTLLFDMIQAEWLKSAYNSSHAVPDWATKVVLLFFPASSAVNSTSIPLSVLSKVLDVLILFHTGQMSVHSDHHFLQWLAASALPWHKCLNIFHLVRLGRNSLLRTFLLM